MGDNTEKVVDCTERDAIHLWFGLTYASYLVLPRTVLQSMPDEWQARFVKMMDEVEEKFSYPPEGTTYDVRLKDDISKRYVSDDLANYERGRRILKPRNL